MTAARAVPQLGRYLDPDACIRLLGRALRDTASLPGAACKSRGDLFTSEHPDDQAAAVEICRGCPELAACREWVASLPRSRIPAAVIAGQLHQPQPARATTKKGTTT